MDHNGSQSGPEQEDFSEPESQRPARKSRRKALVLSTAGILALGLLSLLVIKANNDKSELQDRLDSSEAEVVQLTSRLEADSQRGADLETRLAAAEGELEKANEQVKVAGDVRGGVIDFLAASLSVGIGLSQSDGECIAEALADEMGVAELLLNTLAAADLGVGTSGTDAEAFRFGLALVEAAETCGVSPDESTLDRAFGYGDNAALDALYDQCDAGQMTSCDQLYLESVIGSDYERFAATCGARFEVDDAPTPCDAAVGAAAVISGSPLPPFAPGREDAAIGLNAPMVIGFDFDSAEVAIGSSGRPTAVVFLAHWCPHCQVEVPRVQAWLDSGGGVAGVDIVGVVSSISAARSNYPPSDWLEREGWTPPVLVDGDDGAVMSAFGTGAFPSWVFLNADGTVAARSTGELDIAALEAFLEMIAP